MTLTMRRLSASRFSDRLAMALFLGCVAWLARPILGWWLWEWQRPDSPSAYAPVVPILTGLLFFQRRTALAALPARPTPAALGLLALGLTLLVIAARRELLALGSLALGLTALATLLFFWGPKKLRAAFVPLLLLASMVPLPGPLLSDLTLGAQRLSATLATQLFALMGLQPIQSGTTIQLGRYALEVEAPCAGFKLLLTLLVLGSAFTGLTDLPRGKKWALLAALPPLALLVNALRIALVGLVGEATGFSAAQRFHDTSGYLSLGLCLTVLFSLAKGLGCKTLCNRPLF
jgi:exosortase